MYNHYLPLPCDLTHGWTTFVYMDGSKKRGSAPLRAAATRPSSRTSLRILITSTPQAHTINRAKLAAIDLGLKLSHPTLLSDSACSLRLIHKSIGSAHTMQQHPQSLTNEYSPLSYLGARRRRSSGGPGGGCARMPVGIPSPPRGWRWKPRSRARLVTVGG
jgi:hypothetical protein